MHTGSLFTEEGRLSTTRPLALYLQLVGFFSIVIAYFYAPPFTVISEPLVTLSLLTISLGSFVILASKNFYFLELGCMISFSAIVFGSGVILFSTPNPLILMYATSITLTLVVPSFFFSSIFYFSALILVWIVFYSTLHLEFFKHPASNWLLIITIANCIVSISAYFYFRLVRSRNLKLNKLLHELAFKDELTKIDNRRCFLAKASRCN